MTYDIFRPNQKMYVTLDGTFGDASDLMFVDTSRWTSRDFDLFDDWTDGKRWDFVATGTAATTTPTEQDGEVLS